ncbi:MAG TPA: maleylacetoacetate isomerase [Steroidobacteraceae bacterium]|nr:maleylacetoacetate isomerase [Steroidobacteraceae bacterium]
MKLYHYYRSSAAYRVRIALNYKGIEWETALVDLRPPVSAQHRPEFRAVNPQGLIPVVMDGDVTVTQSLAIIEYLDETHPEPPLLPRSPVDRAQVRSLALAVACDIHPLGNTRVLAYLRATFGADDKAVNAWVAEWIGAGFRALEERVRRTSGDGRHMFGSQITLADLCIVPQMYNARRYEVDVQPYPRLREICAHLERLPAFARAAPEAQPDAPH